MEVTPKPSVKELKEHYRDKYYQFSTSDSYNQTYTKDELLFMDYEAATAIATINKFSSVTNALLDVGCGEGYFSKYFFDKGWTVNCIDFSIDGIQNHNPCLLPYFEQVDLMDWLETEKNRDIKFGLINLDNVLEHVIDPKNLLLSIKPFLEAETILRIEVPNDFSNFQKFLKELDLTEESWIVPPEHLTYFNRTSLIKLIESLDYRVLSIQADFPIEQFLINEHSNYNVHKDRGKAAHLTRILITNYLSQQNLDRYVDYREAAADLDFGRVLTAYVKLNI